MDELAREIEEMRRAAREAEKVMEVVEELVRGEEGWGAVLGALRFAAAFASLATLLYATAGLDGLLASLFALAVGAVRIAAGVSKRAG